MATLLTLRGKKNAKLEVCTFYHYRTINIYSPELTPIWYSYLTLHGKMNAKLEVCTFYHFRTISIYSPELTRIWYSHLFASRQIPSSS